MNGVKSQRYQTQAGVTMIIIAVLLIVMGIAAVVTIGKKEQESVLNPQRETAVILEEVRQALVGYQRANHMLPCAADQGLGDGDANYGIALSNCGVVPADNVGVADSDGLVHIGAVPVETLGVPAHYAADGWGNRISYVVSVNLTDPIGYSAGGGAITIAGLASMPNAAFVLLSHGENGVGTVRHKSGNVIDWLCTKAGQDAWNCPARMTASQAAFLTLEPNREDGANYFDDVLAFAEVDMQATISNASCIAATTKWIQGGNVCEGAPVNLSHGEQKANHHAIVGTGNADVICKNSRLYYDDVSCAP